MARAATTQGRPQLHNRYNVRIFLIFLVAGLMLCIGGPLTGAPGFVPPGLLVIVISLPPIWVIFRGRGNPWWMRSPFDPGSEGARARDPALETNFAVRAAQGERGPRVIFGLSLAACAAFVIAGIALIVEGISSGRGYAALIGAVCIFLFGGTAWCAAAMIGESA